MDTLSLIKKAEKHLQTLCSEIPERRVGGPGNLRATAYVKEYFSRAGWKVEETPLSVMDWKGDGAKLTCGTQTFEVFSSHYSLGFSGEGELVAVDTPEKLEKSDITGKLVLLHGAIASEQIMPKNFIFYNPEEHRKIIALLEEGKPKAIICATGHNPEAAGGVYPFPLFEDGDFDIPSVYMKDTEGEKLLGCVGQTISLESKASRIPAIAFNEIARKEGTSPKRIAVTAHIDAKIGTPGAIDNATGVTVLLLLADLLKDYAGKYPVELIAFNGEDYYAVPGQMKYIQQNMHNFDKILLNINIDGAGYKDGPSCFSSFQLPEDMAKRVQQVLEEYPDIVEGLPWYQGDHSIFLQNGCPAIAVSSDWFIRNMENQEITHTPKDNLEIVNYKRVAECALGIKTLIDYLNEN